MILNQIITDKLIGFPAYAVVDADFFFREPSPSIFTWEFCTIENALINPVSIFEVLEPYKEKTGISCPEDVEKEMFTICEESLQDEIDKRLATLIPPFKFNFKGRNLNELVIERDDTIKKLNSDFTDPDENKKILEKIQKIIEELKNMVSSKMAFTKFNGKTILGKFYQKILVEKGIVMGFNVFCYSIAKNIGEKSRTPESIKKVLVSIRFHD